MTSDQFRDQTIWATKETKAMGEASYLENITWTEFLKKDPAIQDRFFLKNNFYWSILDLQCCISLRCTAK